MAADDDHSTGTREPRHRLRQRFEVIRKLGHGTYGKVQLAVNKETGQEVAIKTIKKAKIENGQDLIRIRREIQIMSYVQHPHIIHIHEVFENKEKIVLVMQYASGGELYDYLKARKGTSEADSRRIFRQIVSAVYYCHKNKICHRDLKLENILLDERGNAKIADFGLSNVFSDDKFLHTFCGSPLYASPEIVKGKPYYGPEVDCWSLGVLLYTLIYGAMPFDGSNFRSLVRQISEGDYYEPKRKSDASGLIQHLLTVKPSKRATVADICDHWWVNLGYEHPLSQVAEDMANFSPINVEALLNLPQTNRSEQCKSPQKHSRSRNLPTCGHSGFIQESSECKPANKASVHVNTNYEVVNSDSVSCSDDSIIVNSVGSPTDAGIASSNFPTDFFHLVPDKNAVSKTVMKPSDKKLSDKNQDNKKHISESEFTALSKKLSEAEEVLNLMKGVVSDKNSYSPEITKKCEVIHNKQEISNATTRQDNCDREEILGKNEEIIGYKPELLKPTTEKLNSQQQVEKIASENTVYEEQIYFDAQIPKKTIPSEGRFISLKENNKNCEMSENNENTLVVHIRLPKPKQDGQNLMKQPMTDNCIKTENKTTEASSKCLIQGNEQNIEKINLSKGNSSTAIKHDTFEMEESNITSKVSYDSISTCVNKSVLDDEKSVTQLSMKTVDKTENKPTDKAKDVQDDKKLLNKKGPGKLVIPKFFEAAQPVGKTVDNKKVNKPLWAVSDAKKAFENKPQEKKPIYIPTRRVSDARSKFEQKIESNQVSTLPRRASKHSSMLKEDLNSCSSSSLKIDQGHNSEQNGSFSKVAGELNISKSSCIKNSCEESNDHQIFEKENGAEIEISEDNVKKTSADPGFNDTNTAEEKITGGMSSETLPSTSSFNEDKISGRQNRTDISETEDVEVTIKVSSNSVDLESAPLTQNSNPTIMSSQQNSSVGEIMQVVCHSNNVIDAITEQQHKCNHEGTTAISCDNEEHKTIKNGLETSLQPLQEIKITCSDSTGGEHCPDVCSKEKPTSRSYSKEETEQNRIDNVQTTCSDSGNCSDNEVGIFSKTQSINNQSSGYVSENHSSFGGEEQDVKEFISDGGTKLQLLKTFMEEECSPLNSLLQNGSDHPHDVPHQGHKRLLPSNIASPYNDVELGINNSPMQCKRSHHSRRRHSDTQSFLKPSSNDTTYGLRDISDLPESCYDDMLRLLNSQDRNKCSAPSVFSKHRYSRNATNRDHQARIQQWFKSEQRNGHSTDRDSSDNDDDFDIHLDYSYPVSNAHQKVIEDTLAPAQCSMQFQNKQRPVGHAGYRSIDEFTLVGNYKDGFLSSEEVQNIIGVPSRNMNYIRRHSPAMRYKDPYLSDITSRYIHNPLFQPLFPGYHHSNNILREQFKMRPNAAELYGTMRRSSCKGDVLELTEQRDSLYPSNSICRNSLYSKQSTTFGRDIPNVERVRQNYTRSLSIDIPHHSGRTETNLQLHIPQNCTINSMQGRNFDKMHIEQDNIPSTYSTDANSGSNHDHCNTNSDATHHSGGETKIKADIMQCEVNKLEPDKNDSCSTREISEHDKPLFKSEQNLLQNNTLETSSGNIGTLPDQNVNTCNRNHENGVSFPSTQTNPIAVKAPSVSLLEALKMQGYRSVIAQNLNSGSGLTRSSISDGFRPTEEQDCLKSLQSCKEQENVVEKRNTNDTACLSTQHPNLAVSGNQFPQYENLTFQQINGKQQLATVQESNESLSCKFDSDQEESVSDRIWRKSFYSRFNDSLSKRRRSCREGDLKAQSISSSSWDILMEDNFKEDILSRRRSSLTLGSNYTSTLPRSGIKAISKHHSCNEASDPLLQINDSSMIHKNSYRQKCNKNSKSLSLDMVESISEDKSSFPVQRSAHSIGADRDLLYTTSVSENPYNRRYGTVKSTYSNNNRQILTQLRGEEDCRSGTRMVGILPRRRYSTFDGYLYMQKTVPDPALSFLDSTNAENDEFS